jgi:hypothetical protein
VIKNSLVHYEIGAKRSTTNNECRARFVMDKNLKAALSAVALGALVAAPAVAKSRTHTEHTAPAVAYGRSTVILPGQVPGTDPDPRIRAELRRDGSSSWEAD